jgi:hypothetical protein
MEKLDLKKEYHELFAPPANKVVEIVVPRLKFIRIDGAIEAGQEPATSQSFQAATSALYSVAYTLKFTVKQREQNPVDYPVMALEGFWWVVDGQYDFKRKDNWSWTLQIMQPDLVDEGLFQAALNQAARKKPNPALAGVRLEQFEEGRCIQTMHIGPYSQEMLTVDRLKAYCAERRLRPSGRHHELYLSDPRRGDPAKTKTILRYAVEAEA